MQSGGKQKYRDPRPISDAELLLRAASGIFARQSESEREISAQSGKTGPVRDPTTGTKTESLPKGSPALSTAVWIDSETRKDVGALCDDITLYTMKSFNNPTLGLHYVQQHSYKRAPKIVECGRALGKEVVANDDLLRDSEAVAEQTKHWAENDTFARIADSLTSEVSRLRSTLPPPPPPPAVARPPES